MALSMKYINVSFTVFDLSKIGTYFLSDAHTIFFKTKAESNPLSYTACAEFVAGFDHLYRLRDTAEYSHQNPMLRNPNVEIDISDFKAGSSFFDQIQFPLAYNFPQDDETGVVDRSFTQDAFNGGSSAKLANRKFSLVDPETNMALSVTDCVPLSTTNWVEDEIDIGTVGTTGSSTVSNDNTIEVSGAGTGELYFEI